MHRLPKVTHSCALRLDLQLAADLNPLLGREGLGPFNRGTDSAVNDKLRQHTNGTRDTEEDSVVLGLSQAIVLQENTRMSIDVGPRVLGLAVLGKNLGSDLVDLADELEHGILGQVLCGMC